MEIIYGMNPVKEALKAGRRRFVEIIISRQNPGDILSLSKGISVHNAPRGDLDRMLRTKNHQGIAARVSAYPYVGLADITDKKIVVLLDTIEDPQNLGSIIRSTYALADAGIVIPENRSASITPAVVKASAGATEHAGIARVKNLRASARELKDAGFWLIGLDAGSVTPVSDIPAYDKIGLVLGGEDTGTRPVIQKEVDVMAKIPMKGPFNSLNVAQSAAIGLYELASKR